MLFDPFAPLSSILLANGRAGFLPPADLAVSRGDIVLTMDVPGLTADDLHIEVLGDELVVRGERKRPEPQEGSQWTHTERTFGSFERRIRLPKGVDPDAITANIDNGVLSLIVPKPEAMKPKTIAIGSGNAERQLETATA